MLTKVTQNERKVNRFVSRPYLYEIAGLKTAPDEDCRERDCITEISTKVQLEGSRKGEKTYMYPVMKQNAAKGAVE